MITPIAVGYVIAISGMAVAAFIMCRNLVRICAIQKEQIDKQKSAMEQAKKAISRMQGVIENISTLAEKSNDRYKIEIEHLQSQIKDLQK